MQYAIFEGNMERLRKKMVRIKNKCQKYGCDFTFAEVGEEFREVQSEDGQKHIARFVLVETEGTAIVNGWKFIAAVEHTEKGNIIRSACQVEVPARYYDCPPVCEHCNSKRFRKDTYIVMNEETGEFKQVGKSCLNDFTHGMSAEGVAQFLSWFDELIEYEAPVGGSWGVKYFKTFDFLCYAVEVISHWGYVKDYYERTTKERTCDYFNLVEMGWHPYLYDVEIKLKSEMASVHFNPYSESNVAKVKEILQWISDQEESSNYIHNLKTVCALECSDYTKTGLLVSIFPAYDRELEHQAEQARRENQWEQESITSNHIGCIGDRIEIKVQEVKCISSWETEFGTTHLYKITDNNGNVFIWKSSKYLDDGVQTIKGTVKDHKEFRGTKQTEITRCRVA